MFHKLKYVLPVIFMGVSFQADAGKVSQALSSITGAIKGGIKGVVNHADTLIGGAAAIAGAGGEVVGTIGDSMEGP